MIERVRATHPFALFLSLAASALVAGAGCGAGEAVPLCNAIGADDLEPPLGPLVHPPQLHTGFNGRDTYQAVVATNFGVVEYTSADEQVVTAEQNGCVENNGFGVTGLLTAQGPGQTTITARSGSFSRTVPVIVAEYTVEQFELGAQRYNDPANPAADRVACADCHSGPESIPHTPLEMAIHSDAEVLDATRLGKYPDVCISSTDSAVCSCTPEGADPDAACVGCPEGDCVLVEGQVLDTRDFGGGPGEHVWNLTPDEEIAVLAFMRALPPDGVDQ